VRDRKKAKSAEMCIIYAVQQKLKEDELGRNVVCMGELRNAEDL
jgi:hypothetical protein